MAKESLGYVELEWTCPFCNTRNPGRAKVCRNCGAPQPKDVQFEQAAEDQVVSDAEGLELAKGEADIHCPFCGTRNAATAVKCVRCGGDLTEGERREAGQVLGGAQTKPAPDVTCAYCGTKNKATNIKCTNCGSPLGKEARPKPAATPAPAATPVKMNPLWLILGGVLLLVICGAIALFFMRGARTETSVARVSDVGWQRSIVVLGYAPVSQSAWADQIPSDADVGRCTERERGRSAFATGNSEEVCGTPYIVDQGTGFGEMVQDCEYIVYDDYCEYTVIQLQPIGVLEESGSDLAPFWPETRLESDQQLGQRDEVYEIAFDVDGETYTYQTTDANEFAQFQRGSEWQLEINGFGDIVGIQPAPLTRMEWLYRLSSLLRWYDLNLGYNRVIVLLSAIGGALGFVVGWLSEPSVVTAVGRAAVAGLTAFGAAALAKEIDPDHPRSAVLTAALAIPAAAIALPQSLPALLWLILLLRFINRATGLAPKWTDAAALLLLAGWHLWRGGPLFPGLRFATPLFAVLTGAVLIVDALLPHGRRAHAPLGGLVVAGTLTYWAINSAGFAATPHETWLTVVLLLITIATIGVILTCYVILMPGDATGRPLDSSRFQAAQIVALAVGLSFASWHGQAGAALFVALWAALLGAIVTYWVNIGARQAPVSS